MIRVLQWLFTGHIHKWKTLSQHSLWGSDKATRPHGVVFIQQCEHCGTVRQKRLAP
jgi:hypothetical protein